MIAPESTTVPSRSKRTTGKRATEAIVSTASACALSSLLTARELERADASGPRSDHDEVGRQVLLRVPERAVVGRIDAHLAVVAPAAFRFRLRAAARVEHLLGLGHLPRRVAGRAAGVPDRRVVV